MIELFVRPTAWIVAKRMTRANYTMLDIVVELKTLLPSKEAVRMALICRRLLKKDMPVMTRI